MHILLLSTQIFFGNFVFQLIVRLLCCTDHREIIGCGIKKRHISSASSALVIGAALGLIQAVILICAAKPMLTYMGVKPVSFVLVFLHNIFILN